MCLFFVCIYIMKRLLFKKETTWRSHWISPSPQYLMKITCQVRNKFCQANEFVTLNMYVFSVLHDCYIIYKYIWKLQVLSLQNMYMNTSVYQSSYNVHCTSTYLQKMTTVQQSFCKILKSNLVKMHTYHMWKHPLEVKSFI